MVNEVYRLMKAGVAKRILFLVDRRALAAQAVRAFASHDPEPNQKFDKIYEVYSQRFHREDFDEDEKFDPKVLPNSYLTSPKPGHAFVYVSTIQRMTVNLFGRNAIFNLGDEAIDEDAAQLNIPIHAFDLVIADECHRGYTASEAAIWRQTLDHFDAIIEDIWENRDREYNIRRLVKRLHRIDKQMSAKARGMFAAYIPAGDVAKFAKELPAELRRDFTGAMALLRDPTFQDLLMNNDRAPRTFLIAYETEDTVTSEWLVKGAGGKEFKPEDYLTAFARFVRENPAHIEAIRILLKRPRNWTPQALSELKQKLAASAERFSVPNLQKAHEVCYHKALVDIIS